MTIPTPRPAGSPSSERDKVVMWFEAECKRRGVDVMELLDQIVAEQQAYVAGAQEATGDAPTGGETETAGQHGTFRKDSGSVSDTPPVDGPERDDLRDAVVRAAVRVCDQDVPNDAPLGNTPAILDALDDLHAAVTAWEDADDDEMRAAKADHGDYTPRSRGDVSAGWVVTFDFQSKDVAESFMRGAMAWLTGLVAIPEDRPDLKALADEANPGRHPLMTRYGPRYWLYEDASPTLSPATADTHSRDERDERIAQLEQDIELLTKSDEPKVHEDDYDAVRFRNAVNAQDATRYREALVNLIHNVEWLVERDPSPSPKASLERAKAALADTPADSAETRNSRSVVPDESSKPEGT